jgi:hypothetical protein
MSALTCLSSLNLPHSFIAAGFVRNLVWDYLHEKAKPTPLNDVDVIYFDNNETNIDEYKEYQKVLHSKLPELTWQVRNQALMHSKHGDKPYHCSIDAMRYWPEKETAIAIRMLETGELECISAFELNSLFNLQLSHNPQRDKAIFNQRIKSKGWLKQWPLLTIK